jgi:monoamine oxidase
MYVWVIICFHWDDDFSFRIVSGINAEFPIEIELQAIVRQILFDKKTKKYKVRTFDRQQHEADIVIVAVPLGILQKGEIVFGEPQKNSTSSVANMPENWHNSIRKKLGTVWWTLPHHLLFF